jgi:hypothetical protein
MSNKATSANRAKQASQSRAAMVRASKKAAERAECEHAETFVDEDPEAGMSYIICVACRSFRGTVSA